MAIYDDQLKRLRALKVIEAKITQNLTKNELAEKFNVNPRTIERVLTWAKRAQLFVEYEDSIMSELVPLAHKALVSALKREALDGESATALEVFKGTNLFRKQGSMAQSSAGGDDELEQYINHVRQLAQERENTIEGAIVDGNKQIGATSSEIDTSNDPGEVSLDSVFEHTTDEEDG